MNRHPTEPIDVELVEHSSQASPTGIGRYLRELYNALSPRASVRLVQHVDPPLTHRLSFLHDLPLDVRAHQPGSIVHFTQALGCSQLLWRPVRPAIVTIHDLGMLVWKPEARTENRLDRFLLRLSYLGVKRADTIIAVSENSRQNVIRYLGVPPERVKTVYSGNNHSLFGPVPGARARLEARYKLPYNGNYKYLLYVGSELPRKNLATLLRVLSQLPPNVRLLKVGWPGRPKFREATVKIIEELNLCDRVLFFEKVSDEDLALLYNSADVYVCASYLEGFCHPVVEAMACGLPVVCSNAACLPEVAGDAAILAPPGDVRAFAEAVSAVLADDGLRDGMAARGLIQAARFSWDQTAKEVLDIYRQVAARVDK